MLPSRYLHPGDGELAGLFGDELHQDAAGLGGVGVVAFTS